LGIHSLPKKPRRPLDWRAHADFQSTSSQNIYMAAPSGLFAMSQAPFLLFLVIFLAVGCASADDGNDFSNNLFSDLAP
jgi:hypothetical protein